MKLHFEDCPHGCNHNGQLFDRALGRFINCPYCEGKRKEAIENGLVEENEETSSVHEQLGFSDKYLTSYFDFRFTYSRYGKAPYRPDFLR